MSVSFLAVRSKETDTDSPRFVDRLRVNVDYMKGSGIVMSLFCGKDGDYGVALNLSSGEFLSLDPIKRLNSKKVEEWRRVAEAQVRAEAGEPWAFIERYCKTHGLTIVES